MIRDTLPRTGLLFAHKTQRTHPGGEGDGGGRTNCTASAPRVRHTHTASPALPTPPRRGRATLTCTASAPLTLSQNCAKFYSKFGGTRIANAISRNLGASCEMRANCSIARKFSLAMPALISSRCTKQKKAARRKVSRDAYTWRELCSPAQGRLML